jgi:hypothetical protein
MFGILRMFYKHLKHIGQGGWSKITFSLCLRHSLLQTPG